MLHLAFQIHPGQANGINCNLMNKRMEKTSGIYIQRRRYGGDLEGIIKKPKLSTIAGHYAISPDANFVVSSSHKYDALCHHHVDPDLRTNTPKETKSYGKRRSVAT